MIVHWLPQGFVRAAVTLYPSPALAVEMPGATRGVVYKGTGTDVPVPVLTLVCRDVLDDLSWWLYAREDDVLHPYRLANCHDGGDICWGSSNSEPLTARQAWADYWAAPVNQDLWDFKRHHSQDDRCSRNGEETVHRCDPDHGECECEFEHDCQDSHAHEHNGCEPACLGARAMGKDGVHDLEPDEGYLVDGAHDPEAYMRYQIDIVYDVDGAGRYAESVKVFTDQCTHCRGSCSCDMSCACEEGDCDCHTDDMCPCQSGDCDCADDWTCACASGDCNCDRNGCRCDFETAWHRHLTLYDPTDTDDSENLDSKRESFDTMFPPAKRIETARAEALLVFEAGERDERGHFGPRVAFGSRVNGQWVVQKGAVTCELTV